MSKKILVVDDVDKNVKLLADLLAAKGYVTCTAMSGAEALDKVKAEQPDLVLLDVIDVVSVLEDDIPSHIVDTVVDESSQIETVGQLVDSFVAAAS